MDINQIAAQLEALIPGVRCHVVVPSLGIGAEGSIYLPRTAPGAPWGWLDANEAERLVRRLGAKFH